MSDKGLVFDIKRDASEDGPGIRTTVFFKGCPLSCVWCQNPEGKLFKSETDINGEQVGSWMTVDELLYRLLQDKPFFTSTGGGVTLSGGEATMQMDVASQLLQRLKAEGVHTAIETSGFFKYDRFRETMLPWLDLIYFDLKLIDDAESRMYCGRSNTRILENFSRLLKNADIPIMPRIPLVPGITATEQNLRGIAAFLDQYNVKSCSLIPYNPLWKDKLQKLGIESAYNHSSFMTLNEQRSCANCFTS
ncbi:MAG: radical SAM protein [Gammaproteobacteria bacterium]|nr:radical SAM protein [Gammaproteobacteria bacterium]